MLQRSIASPHYNKIQFSTSSQLNRKTIDFSQKVTLDTNM